jgi:hypothetical protein
MHFKLQQVEYMPSQLEPGIVYYSAEFETAAHLCACGCGSKIRTPIARTEWAISEGANGPTLDPSIGNWQQKCQSHYFIRNGQVLWANKWSKSQIEAGRAAEHRRRVRHYDDLAAKQRPGIIKGALNWLRRIFGI